MNEWFSHGGRMSRRQFGDVLSAAGLGAALFADPLRAKNKSRERAESGFLLGVDSWSFSFAFGMRDVKPARRMTAVELLTKVRQWGLRGAQVGTGDMPRMGTPEFDAFQKQVHELGLYWEVSAGMVQHEGQVRHAMDYNAAMGSKVVRAFMEGFGIQFKDVDMDAYIDDAVRHIKNLLPEFERRGLYLCLENHGGLRMKQIRRVLKTFPSEHLGLNLDTGNGILTFEDPLEVVEELAPRTYTCHLKDWNIIRSKKEGLIVLGCALGDGVVDLKAALDIISKRTPCPAGLDLSIEAPQEYLPLRIPDRDFWKYQSDVTAAELANILHLAEERNMPLDGDDRIASMRGEPIDAILTEEEKAIARSVDYCRNVRQLL